MKHKILFLLFIFSLISCKKKYPITNYQGLIYPTVIQKETITEGCFFDRIRPHLLISDVKEGQRAAKRAETTAICHADLFKTPSDRA